PRRHRQEPAAGRAGRPPGRAPAGRPCGGPPRAAAGCLGAGPGAALWGGAVCGGAGGGGQGRGRHPRERRGRARRTAAGRGRRGGGRPGPARLGGRAPPPAGRGWAGRGGAPGAGVITAADREEAFAAWRRFLHGLAATRPLVLALEDLHRADDALLDFVEGLADGDAGPVPPLGAAPARTCLRERRPGWGAAGTTIRLGPLGDLDTTGLLATLLEHHGLP